MLCHTAMILRFGEENPYTPPLGSSKTMLKAPGWDSNPMAGGDVSRNTPFSLFLNIGKQIGGNGAYITI
jgi:hypothetical protein